MRVKLLWTFGDNFETDNYSDTELHINSGCAVSKVKGKTVHFSWCISFLAVEVSYCLLGSEDLSFRVAGTSMNAPTASSLGLFHAACRRREDSDLQQRVLVAIAILEELILIIIKPLA